MFQAGPSNSEWIEFYATGGHGSIAGLVGMNEFPMKVELMADLTILSAQTVANGLPLVAKDIAVGPRLTLDFVASDKTLQATFDSTRSAATLEATGEITLGERVTLFGVDDGETVKLYLNGDAGDTSGEWTAAQGANPISTDANPIYVAGGLGGFSQTYIKLHELWLKVNDIVCVHIRPKKLYAGLTTIPDLSGYGNDMALTGTEGTHYRWGSVWNKSPAFSGKESLG